MSAITYDQNEETEFYALDNYIIELVNQTHGK